MLRSPERTGLLSGGSCALLAASPPVARWCVALAGLSQARLHYGVAIARGCLEAWNVSMFVVCAHTGSYAVRGQREIYRPLLPVVLASGLLRARRWFSLPRGLPGRSRSICARRALVCLAACSPGLPAVCPCGLGAVCVLHGAVVLFGGQRCPRGHVVRRSPARRGCLLVVAPWRWHLRFGRMASPQLP